MDYTQLAAKENTDKASTALQARHFKPRVLASGREALEYIKSAIPQGASVMNGASTTLQQIGYIDYLKAGEHGWNNLHASVLAEQDKQKQALLRRQSAVSDYYLGSVHAVTETGELVIGSNSGSQLAHLAYTSPNLILVVSTKKIVPTLADAFDRIEKHVIPLEDERMKQTAGYGTAYNKTLILRGENPAIGRSVEVLLVNEDLGF
jgi:L-lactate utilization protein LutC